MARTRVEVNKEEVMEGMALDTEVSEVRMEIPKSTPAESKPAKTENSHDTASSDGLVNCLRNERIIVRFVPRPTSMVQNKNHILYGGMAETAKRSFVVPRLNSSGLYKNVLTNSEKAFLEHVMGLEYNALSVHKRENNFWDDSNPNGIGRVVLHKQDNYFDLSIPEQYIQYKILLANKDQIASSLQELEDRPKATYQFVIISENAEAQSNLSKMDVIQRCYMEYGKIEDDADTLKTIIELLEGRPMAPKVKLDFLKGKVNEYIQRDPRRFLNTIKDELLPAKVLLKKALEHGLVGKKNDTYYLRQDGSPLCEMNEESTLNNAAKYLSSVKHQELKYMLEAKVKE